MLLRTYTDWKISLSVINAKRYRLRVFYAVSGGIDLVLAEDAGNRKYEKNFAA
jgi:hypothetical protein